MIALALLPLLLSFSNDQASFACANGHTLNYTLVQPQEVTEGKTYPLVLCLHGSGGGTQAARALSKRKTEPCFVFTPAISSKTHSWAGRRTKALPYVFEALDAFMKTHPVNPDRIYVTGQSMGGQGTWGAVSARPTFFAAAVPVCGGWEPALAKRFKDVPIWAFHGQKDRTVPVSYSREMVEALRAAGGTPKYTEYQDVGHNAWTRAYDTDAMWTWMFKQRRAQVVPPVVDKGERPLAPAPSID